VQFLLQYLTVAECLILDQLRRNIRVVKQRRFMWVGHVSQVSEMRNVYNILVGKAEGKIPLGKPRVDGKIKVWTGFIWLKTGISGDLI
jgi:hypothetical protein